MPTERLTDDKSRFSRRQDAALLALTGLLGLLLLVSLPGRWYALGGFALGALTVLAVWLWDAEG